MLTVLRNAEGRLDAVCEWWLVDNLGLTNWTTGGKRWVWVEQLELSDGIESTKMIRQLIKQIAEMVPHAVGSYWFRRDKTDLKPHEHSRQRLVREEVGV